VFVYVSDLAPILAGGAHVLSPEGLLAFTVETHSGDNVKLLATLRYAHGEPYIRRVLAEAGLAPASIAKAAVRSEKGVPVDSLVVVARHSTTAHPPASSDA
jgi:predicted TPR repeat methyltransferase